MAVRLKGHWHNEESDRSMEEIGGALAFNAWKIALDKAITLHSERFVYEDDAQRLGVIAEYLVFQAQVADRLAHDILEEGQRRSLVTALVLKMAEHMEENGRELLGEADHHAQFIARFNQRAAEYAEFGFTADGPSYPFLRHLGYEIQQIMGDSQENRWIIDQVMDKDGPEVFKQLQRVAKSLLY